MKLAELPFLSIQGEGPKIGQIALFIRFQGCSMQPPCSFCDTGYSIKKPDDKVGIEVSFHDILDIISQTKIRNVVFTGGEPLLYQNDIAKLIPLFDSAQIETNGIETLDILSYHTNLNDRKKIFFNISPKLHSIAIDSYFGNIKDIVSKQDIYGGYCLKLVYSDNDVDIIDFLFKLNPKYITELSNHVYIMPECKTRDEHLEAQEGALDFCKKYGFNFCPRAHILMYDRRKGV